MKKMILISSILFLTSLAGFSQTLNKKTLCKKWYLEKYEIMWIDYEPEELERNDYILLKCDMTYVSVDKGVKTNGKWEFNDDKDYLAFYNTKGEGLKVFIDKLSNKKMVLNIDTKELDGLDIHYIIKK